MMQSSDDFVIDEEPDNNHIELGSTNNITNEEEHNGDNPAETSFDSDVHSLPTVAAITGKRDKSSNNRRTATTTRISTGNNQNSIDEDEEYIYGADDNIHQESSTEFEFITFCIIFGLIATAIGLGVGLSVPLKNREYAADDRFRSIVDHLDMYGISRWDALLSDGSPQNKAVNFIAHDDPMQLPIEEPGTVTGTDLITRYVLALIYFAMNGENWTRKLNFLSGDHYCNWFEVVLRQSTNTWVPRGVGCDKNQVIDALFLDDNNLVGFLLPEIGYLHTLRVINFDLNTIHNSIPRSFHSLSNLEHVAIAHNALTGIFPPWIGDLTSLQTLDLSYNFMSGFLPPGLKELDKLKGIALDNNMFHGKIDKIFGSYTDPTGTETYTNELPGLTENIELIYLEGNNFTGSLNDFFLTGMSNLRRLDLSGNSFTGTIPIHFLEMPSLEVLDVNGNNIQGVLPQEMSMTNNVLSFLALHSNNISGPIPSNINLLLSLRHLDVSNNQLSSTIPWNYISELNNLTYLFLANNPFDVGPIMENESYEDGVVVNGLAKLTNLQELSLKGTNRNGGLPSAIFSHTHLKHLKLLDLHNNHLTGPIPSDLGTLYNLEFLLLNGNLLTGQVPTELSILPSLRMIFLDDNDIGGSLDTVFCNHDYGSNGENRPYITADCGVPEIEVLCNCCFRCCSTDQPCNDDDLVPSLDPMWQFGYERIFYSFGDRVKFINFPK